jgi:transcriptional regulator GlxA family with amidase domain
LVAVVGANSGTELIDFVVPYSVLKRSGAAEVLAVGLHPGELRMEPALRIRPDVTVEGFDRRFAEGADYVVVPAVRTEMTADPGLTGWLRSQARKGATIVSICDGALVVANAGLFKGHRATGHWATQAMRERAFPETVWLKNTRYVADGNVISSAGVTAALPLSLALVESIAGSERAQQLAGSLGIVRWDAGHDSEQFHLGARLLWTGARNKLLSSRDDVVIAIESGVDELALALTADTFGRTYRTRVRAVAGNDVGVATRHGLTVLPDRLQPNHAGGRRLALPAGAPAHALDAALAGVAQAYGPDTAQFVATQIEYPYAGP